MEENGQVDPLAASPDPQVPIASSVGLTNNQPHLMTATNIVHLTLPAQSQAQVGGLVHPTVPIFGYYPFFKQRADVISF